MNNIPAYNTKQLGKETNRIRYIFESIGEKSITKVIEYSYLTSISGRKVFNLGFGDYDANNDGFIDNVNSNNGDMRMVFNTVLSTIPKFFKTKPNAGIWVQGSDQKRTRIYCYYVDKHFIMLKKNHLFYGYEKSANPNIVPFKPLTLYDGILVFKKN